MKTDINPCPKRIKSRQKQAVPPKLCGANGIKDLFEVSLSTIYRWAENGTIPSVRVGGRVLFILVNDKVCQSLSSSKSVMANRNQPVEKLNFLPDEL